MDTEKLIERLRRESDEHDACFEAAVLVEACPGLLNEAADALEASTRRVKELEEALAAIEEGNEPRPIGGRWRDDGSPSKYDTCVHEYRLYEDCAHCVRDLARTTLSQEGL